MVMMILMFVMAGWLVLFVLLQFVAPFGSYEAIFGTNPFSIGIPTLVRSHYMTCQPM